MSVPRSDSAIRLRRAERRERARPLAPAAADGGRPAPAPDGVDDPTSCESAEAGWRASSYDLKHGLDVVELPSSLPADVLERLFKAPRA